VIAVASLADQALVFQEPQMLADISLGSPEAFQQFPDEPLALEQHTNDE